MKELYYIGLDVHKKHVSYMIKTATGRLVGAGEVEATRAALSKWARSIDGPWIAALEATLFSSWIYDHLPARECSHLSFWTLRDGAYRPVQSSLPGAPIARDALVCLEERRKGAWQRSCNDG